MPSRAHQDKTNTRIRKSKLSRSPLSEHFIKACEERDFHKIQACLTLGVDINCTDEYNHSGLFKLVGFLGDQKLAEFFIQHPDLDVEKVNRENILGEVSDIDLVRKLCDLQGIDVNAGNPLRWAAYQNNKALIKILAENPELDWNAGDLGDGYPITAALDSGYNEIVELLLEQPTLDLSVLKHEGRSVGHCAVQYRALKSYPEEKNTIAFPVKCVELLSKDQRMDWNIRDDNGDTPIMIALRNKEMEMVRILIKTPGVHLGDVLQLREGNAVLKELLQRADECKDLLKAKLQQAHDNNDILNERLQEALEKNRSLSSKVPECPVCLLQFRSDSRVFQCSEGHLLCEGCNPRLKDCPVCREDMMGRAHGFESFLQDLNF